MHPALSYPDLQPLFHGPKIRIACPVCREAGKDSNGDHMTIGEGRIHCFSDPDHSKGLYGELKALERSGTPTIRKAEPDYSMDPDGSFFDEAYDERGNRQEVTGDSLRLEAEIIIRAAADDLEAINAAGLERVLIKSKMKLIQTTREHFEYAYIAGVCLKWIRDCAKYGDWKVWIVNRGITEDQDKRYRRLASVSWSEIEGFSSIHTAIQYLRGKDPRPKKPNKAEMKAEADAKTIREQDETIKRMRSEDPSTEDQRIKNERLEAKFRESINRLTEKDREIKRILFEHRQVVHKLEAEIEERDAIIERLHEQAGMRLDAKMAG